jgi:hypothetical protein
MYRKLVLAALIGTFACSAVIAWQMALAQQQRPAIADPKLPEVKLAQADKPPPAAEPNGVRKPNHQLPISHVILFSSGVGYFQREGEVEGNSRIDLSFNVQDINDLLKSMVLQDLGNGHISTVSYDSQDPVEKTLRSFALNLAGNPSFGELLNQARGEKVEVTLQQSTTAQPGTVTGVILGMEAKQQPHGLSNVVEVEMLNLSCVEGVRSLKLTDVQRVRFLNPVIDSELKRALEVLAQSHDMQKKAVSLACAGEGKRQVKVGYVVENPIWKTTYRMVLGPNGKVHLQGWAVVENTSDDDWNNIKLSLVSGRPISFQMDLYQPLYIPRPTVEPEKFASLRPPTYSGAITDATPGPGIPDPNANTFPVNPGWVNPSLFPRNRYQQFGNLGGQMGMQGGWAPQGGINSLGQFGGVNLGFQGGGINLGIAGGQAGQMLQGQMGNQLNPAGKLSFDEYQKRRNVANNADKENAKQTAQLILNPSLSVASLATAEEIGDFFQYTIDQKVSLPRQKSALLPIVNKPVEAKRVSIYNEGTHVKFPLLGLKFKNTSGQHLMQGPVAVYEGGAYSGDARVMDLQPNEERLLSYAIDLGTEVKPDSKSSPDQLTAVKVVKGVLQTTHKLRHTKSYQAKNRSEHDRVLIVEHPINAGWKLVTPEKPSEQSRDVYRFELPVAAGKTAKLEVVEELHQVNRAALGSTDDKAVRLFLTSTVTSKAVKDALEKAVALRTKLADTQREIADMERQLKEIVTDQERLRANLARVPPTSATHKRYLDKFDTQETQIEKLQESSKKMQEIAKQQKKEYEDYVAGLSVE